MKALSLCLVAALGVGLSGCATNDLFAMSPRAAKAKVTSCDHSRELATSRCFVLHDREDIERLLRNINGY